MPRRSSSGKLQVNLSLDPDAYTLLQKYAPTGKSFGQFLGELLRQHEQHMLWDGLHQRVAHLEAVVGVEHRDG
jgi:hypothetical protein